jgi:hypothetical protein
VDSLTDQTGVYVNSKFRFGKKIDSGSFGAGIISFVIIYPLRDKGGFSY